jgi:DNA modification methylase
MTEEVKIRQHKYNQSVLAVRNKLVTLLGQDLDFHGEITNYASHNFHSFPAKFPPQIPKKFIHELTNSGDTVLDPMVGSGTTILEAFLAGRRAIGFDIDPLALILSKVKVTPASKDDLRIIGETILSNAKLALEREPEKTEKILNEYWDPKTKEFIDYWFAPQTQLELFVLIEEIKKLTDQTAKDFFMIVFSSIIITKSGGVSFALDLGHTRPHKAKIINGKTVTNNNVKDSSSNDSYVSSKNIGSALEDFRRRINKNLNGLLEEIIGTYPPQLYLGDAQDLSIPDNSIDLIVTSPPYASNAIDYMRAHKFSLVWLGHSIETLSKKRKEYIGGEVVVEEKLIDLPRKTSGIIEQISNFDPRKGRILHSYYSDMFRTIQEMYRVLKNGKVAIVVVGTSLMRSINTETAECLAEIGGTVGFEVPKIGIRNLDRDRRMLPIGSTPDLNSLIQQRMHEEYVIGFLKQ